MIHSRFFLPAIAPRLAALAMVLVALLLAQESAQAGADFIGGQANAAEEEDPDVADGAFAERARAMQHWLQTREDERREMGVAHVYERPRAIVDHDDRPRRGHGARSSLKSSGSAHGRHSSRSSGKVATKSRSGRVAAHSRGAGDRRSAGGKASGKVTGKSAVRSTAARSTAKAPAKPARKHR